MAQPSSSSSSSSTSLSTAGRPSVRRSCNACTDAKLGCTKEKPTCARCARRGEICIYSATRRLGRRPISKPPPSQNHGSSQSVDHTSQLEDQRMQPLQRPAPTAVMSITSPAMNDPFSNGIVPTSSADAEPMDLFASIYASGGVTADATSAFFPNFVTSNDCTTTVHSQTPDQDALSGLTDHDLEQMLSFNNQAAATIRQSSIHDNSTLGDYETYKTNRHDSVTSRSSHYGGGHRSMSLSTSNGWFSTLSGPPPAVPFGLTEVTGASGSRSTPSSERPFAQTQVNSAKAACDCFDSSCSLLRRLTPNSLVHHSAGVGASKDRPTNLPSFDSVIAQNDIVLDAVSRMTNCRGAHDSSLLALLSMVVFRAIGWYAAAAASAKTSKAVEHDDPRRMASPCFPIVQPPTNSILGENYPGERPGHAACQLVLSKVYNVQRIINQLSTCLQTAAAELRKTTAPNVADSTAILAQDLLLNGAILDVTSGRMMGELEANLRARLRELSQCIMVSMIDK